MPADPIEELELRKVPRGVVLLCGVGRLGFRVFLRLLETHRGGPERIVCVDGQSVEPDDIVHLKHGARIGENKAEFAARLGRVHPLREVHPEPEFVTEENASELVNTWRPDVVVITIAGGRTTPITAALAREARRLGAVTVSTGGVFGYGGEEVQVVRLEEAEGPVAKELKEYGAPPDHVLVTTGRYIRDPDPITSMVLERVADKLAELALRALPDPSRGNGDP
ncbi:ThiF family adenylyltransferase [Methanopyrus sp.]